MEYNGDIFQVMSENDDLGFVIPKEGSLRYATNLCIPTGAPNPDGAHWFINYLLDAKAGAKISEKIQFPTPNAAALALLPDSFRSNRTIYPSIDDLEKCVYPIAPTRFIESALEDSFSRLMAS